MACGLLLLTGNRMNLFVAIRMESHRLGSEHNVHKLSVVSQVFVEIGFSSRSNNFLTCFFLPFQKLMCAYCK